MKLIDKDTNKDAIVAYLRSPDAGDELLTEKQQSLLKYYSRAYDLIRNYNSVPDVIRVLVKLSIELGEPISQSTARRYVYDAQDIYGYASKSKSEAISHLCQEIIKDAIAMAWRQNNPEAMIRGAKELFSMGGVQEDGQFNPEMFEQHIVEMGMDDHSLELVMQLTGKGVVDLDRLGDVMNELAVDVAIEKDQHE